MREYNSRDFSGNHSSMSDSYTKTTNYLSYLDQLTRDDVFDIFCRIIRCRDETDVVEDWLNIIKKVYVGKQGLKSLWREALNQVAYEDIETYDKLTSTVINNNLE